MLCYAMLCSNPEFLFIFFGKNIGTYIYTLLLSHLYQRRLGG